MCVVIHISLIFRYSLGLPRGFLLDETMCKFERLYPRFLLAVPLLACQNLAYQIHYPDRYLFALLIGFPNTTDYLLWITFASVIIFVRIYFLYVFQCPTFTKGMSEFMVSVVGVVFSSSCNIA